MRISFFSGSILRNNIQFVVLILKHKIDWKPSHSRFEAQDLEKDILVLVSEREIEGKKFFFLSQNIHIHIKGSF